MSVLERCENLKQMSFRVEKELLMQRELVWLVTVLLNALKISWKVRLSGMQSNPFGRLKILLTFHLGSLHCSQPPLEEEARSDIQNQINEMRCTSHIQWNLSYILGT